MATGYFFNYIVSLPHTITFGLNEFGVFSVYQHYNEKVNGRVIYGKKKKLLASEVFSKIDVEKFLTEIENNLIEE